MFLPTDQRELYMPLVEGIHESPPWGLFLRNLLVRTHARHAAIAITLAHSGPNHHPAETHAVAARAAQDPALDLDRLHSLGLHRNAGLRPGRVYALDEVLDYDNSERLALQRTALEDMGIRHGRWLRVSASGGADAWLVLVRHHEDFSASAVATLSAIAPYLASALRTLTVLSELRLQAAMAQSALARLGIGQIALDAGARVIAADAEAERLLTFSPDPGTTDARRLQLAPKAARALESACGELALAPQGSTQMVLLDDRRSLWALLRTADLSEPAAAAAVIATLRTGHREAAADAARGLQSRYGLSAQESLLAHALTTGDSIIDAGLRLGLTTETARNYSKRIYAKTGTVGQADLVRLIMTSLAPLA